ncbi:uncharacterized protein LOC121374562 [Gigantopelta aegis]|uniref:uncharacterized protein LOC121374562 n=1 Tax=Gigantopelta aegis TaxID=1735272 RepID=UPI001B889278|nr:uncharacterized protein LOC121374562 [Gigantopelta aegis]
MAEYNGNKPTMNWQAVHLHKEWKRFQQHCTFRFNGPLATKTEAQKVNYLMTYIGDKGREIYNTFTWIPEDENTPAENQTLEGVYAKYEAYVAPRKKQIRATVNFNRRKQEVGEKFDNFVTDLRILVKDCGYAEEERMVRDAIVLRSVHDTVRGKCLEKGDTLTLEMAINIGQNHEMSQESLKAINDEDPKVHTVRDKRYSKKKTEKHGSRSRLGTSKWHKQTPSPKACTKCGYSNIHKECPARNSKCNFCHKRGHYEKVCRNKLKTHIVDEMYSTGSSAHLRIMILIHFLMKST